MSSNGHCMPGRELQGTGRSRVDAATGGQRHGRVFDQLHVQLVALGELHQPGLAVDSHHRLGPRAAHGHARTNEAPLQLRNRLVGQDLLHHLRDLLPGSPSRAGAPTAMARRPARSGSRSAHHSGRRLRTAGTPGSTAAVISRTCGSRALPSGPAARRPRRRRPCPSREEHTGLDAEAGPRSRESPQPARQGRIEERPRGLRWPAGVRRRGVAGRGLPATKGRECPLACTTLQSPRSPLGR